MMHLEVLVARLRLAEVGGRRHRGAAGGEQLLEDVGEVLAQHTWIRARKPWVWWTCGAPRRSASNASSASALAGQRVALDHA